jgi:hypothetical protein
MCFANRSSVIHLDLFWKHVFFILAIIEIFINDNGGSKTQRDKENKSYISYHKIPERLERSQNQQYVKIILTDCNRTSHLYIIQQLAQRWQL